MSHDDEYLAIFLPPSVARRLTEGAKIVGMTLPEFVQALIDNWIATKAEALGVVESEQDAAAEDWSPLAFTEYLIRELGEEILTPDEIRVMAEKNARRHTAEAAERGKAHLALDHVEIQGNTAHCRHCRTTFARPSTADLATYEAEMRAFAEAHEKCRPIDFKDRDCAGA